MSDSEWKRVVISIKVLFCQQYGVGINIFKMKRQFLIAEATANSSRCTQNLSKFIHSLSLDVPRTYLCINDLRELTMATAHVQFCISDLLTSDLQFQVSN